MEPKQLLALAESVRQFALKYDEVVSLLGQCYDAIMRAIYSEDGLDGSEGEAILLEIEKLIGQTDSVKAWNGAQSSPPSGGE